MNLNQNSLLLTPLRVILWNILCLLSIDMSAQGYENITALSGINAWCDGVFGNGASIYDIDGDGWDDITLGSHNNGIKIYRNLGDGTFEPLTIQVAFDGDAKSIIWIDYDNDFDNDLLITGTSNVVLYQNNGDMLMTDVTAEVGIANTVANCAGSSFGDVNNDGWLDLYICRYYQTDSGFTNILYVSDQAGNFIDETSIWGVENGYQPSFQSTFFDVDRDGDQDLFIINDRTGYTNNFYRNDGDHFTNVSGFYDVDYDMWSMSNTVDDFNNDGYPDIYVTNTITGNALFMSEFAEGEEGFLDVTESQNVSVGSFCWGSAFSDYDNDGRKDLWVLSDPLIFGEGNHYLYTNTGDSFEIFPNAGIEESIGRSYALALGDLNNDGFQDVVTHSEPELGTELWQNLGIGGNFLSIGLKGIISNRPGIGSIIDVYSSNGLNSAFVHCGENYIGQNSAVEHFGLGLAEIADSVVVHWPSGHVDRFLDVPTNEKYIYSEGSSLSAQVTSTSNYLCSGDSAVLDAGDWDQYLWSTGDTTSSINVTEPGDYSVETWTNLGLYAHSPVFTISYAPALSISASIQEVSCYGFNNGTIDLQLDSTVVDSIVWHNGHSGISIDSLHAGYASYLLTDIFGCHHADSILLASPDALLVYYSTMNPTCFDSEDGLLIIDSIQGGAGDYTIDFVDFDPTIMGAGEFGFSITDSLNCAWQTNFELIAPVELTANSNIVEGTIEGTQTIELLVLGGTEPYTFLWTPGDHDTADLIDVIPGEYSVLVTDSMGCTLQETFMLTSTMDLRNSQLIVFPNPAQSEITIVGCATFSQLLVYNTLGQIVLDINNSQHVSKLSVNIGNLASGPYCIRTSNGQIIGRFIRN